MEKSKHYLYLFLLVATFNVLMATNSYSASFIEKVKSDNRFSRLRDVIKKHGLKKELDSPFIFFSQHNFWILTVKENGEYISYQGLNNSKDMLQRKDSVNHIPIKDVFDIVSDSTIMHSSVYSTFPGVFCGTPVIDRFTVIKDSDYLIWNYGYKNNYQDKINKKILAYLYDVFDINIIYIKTKKR